MKKNKTNKRYRIPNGQSKMDASEKLAIHVTQDEEKSTTQYMLFYISLYKSLSMFLICKHTRILNWSVTQFMMC